MPLQLYTPISIRKIRDRAEVKRNFLTAIFFNKKAMSETEDILLEIEKGGEHVAPYITPLESGKPVPDKKTMSQFVKAPNIGTENTLEPKDMFVRETGMPISGGYNPKAAAARKIGKILGLHERYIVNKEELMVGQFLTTGKVTSLGKEAEFELDYGLENISTLSSTDMWDQTGVNPYISLSKIIRNAEVGGIKVENIILGEAAADALLENPNTEKYLSKDLQNEFVKDILRTYPGIEHLGRMTKYGVDLFSYRRKVIAPDGVTQVDILPINMVIGGPSGGTMLYAPIINMGENDGEIHMKQRYSDIEKLSNKVKRISTESRPVLIPEDLDAYFAVTVLA